MAAVRPSNEPKQNLNFTKFYNFLFVIVSLMNYPYMFSFTYDDLHFRSNSDLIEFLIDYEVISKK